MLRRYRFGVQPNMFGVMRGLTAPTGWARAAWANPTAKRLLCSSSPTANLRSNPDSAESSVMVVNNPGDAARVLDILLRPDVRSRYHACDTEVKDIDLKKEGPYGHGFVTCASIFCGEDVDFGGGKNRLWIDNLGEAEGTLDLFKPYFEHEDTKKVWHNYSFDKAVLWNHGIHCKGFGGDTMHMARLWHAAFEPGYSLEMLSRHLLSSAAADSRAQQLISTKKNMNDRFALAKIKRDGTESKQVFLPPIEELQTSPETRAEWIEYSVEDAVVTWYLREHLQQRLENLPWDGRGRNTMFDFYNQYWLPFGEMLTNLEQRGMYLRTHDYLPEIQKRAEQDAKELEQTFLAWASDVACPDARLMNLGSGQQKAQLFFGSTDPAEARVFMTENHDGYIEPGKGKASKFRPISIVGLGLPAVTKTSSGQASASTPVLKTLVGNVEKEKWGPAYEHFGGGEAGERACRAIDALCRVSSINTMLNTFIIPLREGVDEDQRIHCSLNLNTETGRLSSRRPNLQNQPALEKDIYKIRHAFSAAPGNKLVVADYGQLELRILAHMSRCKSMIEAFQAGGDFHSRTAVGMYPEIQEAIRDGKVLLEWDESMGERTLPLVKDVYGSERRKAKGLNFSIAYGKTARGLSQDWGVSLAEAKETLERWYSDRPEVKQWQEQTVARAREIGATRTLMGRYRPLPALRSANRTHRGHAERACINTPIQGGAADVVMKAMLELEAHERFRALGWRVLMQIHDEVIAEGPEESAEEAFEIVRRCMEQPFKEPLLVDLLVDGSIADTWYEAK